MNFYVIINRDAYFVAWLDNRKKKKNVLSARVCGLGWDFTRRRRADRKHTAKEGKGTEKHTKKQKV